MSVLVMTALIAAVLLCIAGIWAAVELARTARDARREMSETNARLIPLMEKADVTVDAVNAELLRIDAIITQFEQAGARVSHASDTISDIVTTPAGLVSEVAGRMRKAFKERKHTAGESASKADSPPAEEHKTQSGAVPGASDGGTDA